MTETFTITTNGVERIVTENTNPNDSYIDVDLRAKEAIDLHKALKELAFDVTEGRFDTDLPVQELLYRVLGGMDYPDNCRVMIASENDARILIHALTQYTPDDADFTNDVQELILIAMEESSLPFDMEPLWKLNPALPGQQASLSTE